jgi:CubicO group peptidase (beta-lactamase class C family)
LQRPPALAESFRRPRSSLRREAGDLALDDPAADHLPPDLDFDTDGATIRQLLGMRSGIPDYRQSRWTPAEVLALVDPYRSPAGESFEDTSTNYILLGLVIKRVRGRPIAEVLRDGVLNIDGVERLIFEPNRSRPRARTAPPRCRRVLCSSSAVATDPRSTRAVGKHSNPKPKVQPSTNRYDRRPRL